MHDTDKSALLENLIYRNVSGSMFTQRSPFMPDVWIRYGMEARALDLLLVAHWSRSGPALAAALEARLVADLSAAEAYAVRTQARIAPTESAAAATLTFRQLMRNVLPLAPYFQKYLVVGDMASYLQDDASFASLRTVLQARLEGRSPPKEPHIHDDILWLVRVAGSMAMLLEQLPDGLASASTQAIDHWLRTTKDANALLDAFFALFAGVRGPSTAGPTDLDEQDLLWAVHRNRVVELAIRESTAAVKADAARHVFDVAGRGIRWVVMDSGVDLRHVAFRKRAADGTVSSVNALKYVPPQDPPRLPGGSRVPDALTRIVATYDFTILRSLLAAPRPGLEQYVEQQLTPEIRERIEHAGGIKVLDDALARTRGQLVPTEGGHRIDPSGRTLDWMAWEPLLRIRHEEGKYQPPRHPHGTHVAGILGADWRAKDLADDVVKEEVSTPRRLVERTGMCPEIEIYDFRVLEPDGSPDELAVLAALQFVRALNTRHNHLLIHGVNVSLSIPHDVSNYACGRTPVCEECDRLVGSGVIVVAAAGNYGREKYVTASGEIDEGYRTVSISDPGNAESVITVGATHRAAPHAFGVSYFSSRGPTGDGRMKPDIVAPGEKVRSSVMHGDECSEQWMDGTSMAAPHVSGAAALLLSRNQELIGRPAEVKRILCSTATDLGRDRYFQGAGLLDTLRALESF